MAGPGRHRGTGSLASAVDGAVFGQVDYRILITPETTGPDQWHVSLVPASGVDRTFSQPNSYFLTLEDGTVSRLYLTPAIRNGRLTLCGNGYAAVPDATEPLGSRSARF